MRTAPSPQMLPPIQEEQHAYASSPDDTVNATTKKRPTRVAFDPSGVVMQRGDVLDRVFEKVEATLCDHRESSSGAQMDPPALLKQSFSIVENTSDDERDDLQDNEQRREVMADERRQGGAIERSRVAGETAQNRSSMGQEDDAISCSSIVDNVAGPPPPRDPTPRMRRTDMAGQVYSSSRSLRGQNKDILDFVFESVEGFICREKQRLADPSETGRVKVNGDGDVNSDSSSPIKLHELTTPETTNETSKTGNICLTNPFQCRVEYKDTDSGKEGATTEQATGVKEDKVGELPQAREAPRKSVMGSLLDVFSMSEDDDVSQTQSVKLDILKTRKRELESQRRAILALDKPEVDLESNTAIQTLEPQVHQSTRPRSRVLLVVAGVSTFIASGILVFFLFLWLG